MGSHALSIQIFLPLVGALAIAATPRRLDQVIRIIAALFAGAAVIMSLWIWVHFDPSISDFQLIEKVDWMSSFRIRYFLGIDGLSLPMVALTSVMTLVAIVGSFNVERRIKEYFFLFLVGEAAMLGVFLALDMFLFYVFWELTLVPMYFLIGMWGGPQRQSAAIKLFLFTAFGSILMLVALVSLYLHAQPHSFDYTELLAQSASLAPRIQLWLFIGLALAFAVKLPMFPFHPWLPLAHVEAPTAGSVILAAVLLKLGAYGLMRFCLPLFPHAAHTLSFAMGVFAAINIVYGALCSLAQTDLKKMIAYSSINHMGYVLLGLASLNVVGFSGALLQMVNHGIITGLLFLMVGVLYDRAHTREIDAFGGLAATLPRFTGFTLFACFASLGLPLLSGFVGEFLCFVSAFQEPRLRLLTGISLLGLLLTAAFFLRMIRKVFYGPIKESWTSLKDMDTRELTATVPLVLLTVVLGIFPGLVLEPVTTTLVHLVDLMRQP